MIKKLTPLLLMLISLSSYAQDTLRNARLENWVLKTTYTDPDAWFTLNYLTDFGFDTTVFKTTDAHSGNYAAMLKTGGGFTNDIPGLLTSGPVVDAQGNPTFNKMKFKFTSRPQKINFWYKSMPVSGDTCTMFMALLKWNALFQRDDTVAMISFNSSQTINTYTLADLSFVYRLPVNPDSAAILFSSSIDGFNPKYGSTFYVDDISLIYNSTGFDAFAENENTFTVYPNPSKGNIRISGDESRFTYKVYDALGKEILAQSDVYEHSDITLMPGIYYIKVNAVNGKNTYHKIVITDGNF
jgi:hypothetical protein